MRDNTKTKLTRGPTGIDDRIVNVESARSSVAAIDYHQALDYDSRPSRRPAHMAGLYVRGTFVATPEARALRDSRNQRVALGAPIFDGKERKVLVRLSPLRTYERNSPFDLHGIAVRIWQATKDEPRPETDHSDFVALNTHPFPFRHPDDFATFFRRMRSGPLQATIGAGAFLLGSVGGNASVVGLWRAVWNALWAKRQLWGRTYWGMSTFFADWDYVPERTKNVQQQNVSPDEPGKRLPYRFELELSRRPRSLKRLMTRRWQPDPTKPDDRWLINKTILRRYKELADEVRPQGGVKLHVWFQIPRRFERLHPWEGVPRRVRDNLINPQADWRQADRIRVGTITLTRVVDDKAILGKRTDPECDDLIFDPTRLAEGLYPSEDPLLAARSGIYAESQMRRLEKREDQ